MVRITGIRLGTACLKAKLKWFKPSHEKIV
jgi:hypothetical protein